MHFERPVLKWVSHDAGLDFQIPSWHLFVFQNSSFDSRNEAHNSIEKQEASSNEAQELSSIDDAVKQNRNGYKKKGTVMFFVDDYLFY